MAASGQRSGVGDPRRGCGELAILKEGPAAAVEQGVKTISFADFKSRLRSSAGLRSLLGRRLRLYVHDLRLLRRPLPLHAALWALSLGRARVIDARGRQERISLASLTRTLTGAAGEWRSRRQVLDAAQRELQELEQGCDVPASGAALAGTCVYLRTDLSFGLQAGGCMGHIAGVVNALPEWFDEILYVGTDLIAGIDDGIAKHVVDEAGACRNFPLLQELCFSRVFSERVLQRLDGKVPALVYQRYSRNNYSGVRIARQLACPLVIEYNSSAVRAGAAGRRRQSLAALTERIELLNLHAASTVVVVSEALKAQLIWRGIAAANILVNPNGVDSAKYRPGIDGGPLRRALGCDQSVVIGFIGTFEQWHGVATLVEAFGRLLQADEAYRQRARLVLMGDGTTMGECRRLIAQWRIGGNCLLTGLVPQESGPQYLAACDILVSPNVPNPDGSPFIGSPTKLFEYMAMGKAIVASDLDQLGDVLADERTAVLVPPASPEALMGALQRLIDEPQTRQRLGVAARAEALEHYTWSRHASRIIDRVVGVNP